jgi:peptidyl-tRNA hydrolase, PTH1 family
LFLVIGLGNPGKIYELNRHNAGFLFLEYLKDKHGFDDFKKKNNYHFTKAVYADAECIFIKPQTYMNLSGNAVVSALGFFKIPKENIAVIYDDIALPFEKIRIRENGSSGGHNGLKNIELMLATQEYKRVRIGVSAPEQSSVLRDYVLDDFSQEELKAMKENIFPTVDDALRLIINFNIKEAMNKFNGNGNKPKSKD